MQYDLEPGDFVINPTEKIGVLVKFNQLLKIKLQLIFKTVEKK